MACLRWHRDIHTLVLRCRISRDNLENTLVRLRELRLLEGEQQGDTRRDALRKLTLAGAGLASVPTISSILVPTAAQAASCVVTITEYPIPPSGSNPLGPLPVGITSGPDGALWFTEAQSGKIGRVTTSGAFTEYSPPTGNSFPQAITRGPDGALWFVENANNIGRVTTSGASRSTRSRHA